MLLSLLFECCCYVVCVLLSFVVAVVLSVCLFVVVLLFLFCSMLGVCIALLVCAVCVNVMYWCVGAVLL